VKDEEPIGPGVPDKLAYRIGEVAEIVGVETHVLRYWEGEFRIRPQRQASGQRAYRRKDLAQFLRIKRLLHDEGYTIAGARKALSEGTAEDVPDDARSQEALTRLAALRERIGAFRARIAAEGVAGAKPRPS
jgi:DNA-binding transcriptional MerR regulator